MNIYKVDVSIKSSALINLTALGSIFFFFSFFYSLKQAVIVDSSCIFTMCLKTLNCLTHTEPNELDFIDLFHVMLQN